MRFKKLLNGLLVLALLGMMATAFVPTAMAQKQPANVIVKVNPQGDQVLKPLQNEVVLDGEATFQADGLSPRSSLTGVTIQYRVVSKPAWATVVISPSSDIITFGTEASQTVSGTTRFKVAITASDQAPAFQAAEIAIEAKALETSATNQATNTATQNIRASYFSIIDVVLPETIKVDRPQTPVIFPIKVTNFGNGPTKVNFEVIQQPENPTFQVLPPPPIQLESKQAGGSVISQDVNLQIQTPYKNGYMNEPGTVVLKITSAYAQDATITGDTAQVGMLVTTKGFYVPGPSPLLLVGLVGIAAVVFRQLRK